MAGTRKTPAKKKTTTKKPDPELVYEDGFWWIVNGTVRVNAGRSERYAQNMLNEQLAEK